MTTSWTIRSRRNVGAAASVIRPVSLNSLPDLSDDLEMGGRSSNGSSALLLPSVGYTIGGLNQSDSSDDALIYRCQSNASVSFLGRQITRQYRSSFVLSDQQMIGVTRCETFKPDESKADVQVSLSLQGPPDESVVPGHQRSRSAPSRVCDCLDDNRGWARLMLTTDRPRDAELLSRFGSRNYYTKCEPNSSYFHRRIIPYYNEEEFMLQPSTPTVVNSSFDTNREGRNEVNERDNFGIHDSLASSTLALTPNPDPFIDRVEKDTCPLPSRHQANHSSPSPLGYLPQSDKDPSSQTPDFLPSTERSESIIYLNRSKSEASLSAAKPAPRDPWRVPPCPDSIDDRSANADSTLSLQTDLENDDAIEDAPAAVPPRVPQPRTQNTEGSLSPSSLSFVSSTNGVLVRLSGPGGQQCVSSFFKEKPKKTATLHTFLPGIDREKDEVGHLGSQFSPVIQEEPELDSTLVESEEGRVVTTQTGESVNVNPIPPLPRERKKLVCSENNILSATQTDGGRGGVDAARPNSSSDQNHPSVGLKGTRNDPNQNVSEERDAVLGSVPQLPPKSEKKRTHDAAMVVFGDSATSGALHDQDSPEIRSGESSPQVTPLFEGSDDRAQDAHQLLIYRDEALSHGNTFRSPFDPRSEDDLLSSTNDGVVLDLTFDPNTRRLHEGMGRIHADDQPWIGGSIDRAGSSNESERHKKGRRDQQGTGGPDSHSPGPRPAPRRPHTKVESPIGEALTAGGEGSCFEDEEEDDSWADDESRLRPPALRRNLQAALAELPVEDPVSRTKRLRSLQYPIYVNVGGDPKGINSDDFDRTKSYGQVKPLKTMDQNIPDKELPDSLVVRTRRRTMSGITGFLPRSTTLSSSSVWFGDHPVPTKTQMLAAEQSPLRLSSIQLQAQAELARRRSRNNLATRSAGGLSRSRSLDRSLVVAPSASTLYGPTGRRVHGGAPLVERAIKRHVSKRDGYETLSLIHVPKIDKPSNENGNRQRPASSASTAKYRAPAAMKRNRNVPSTIPTCHLHFPTIKQGIDVARDCWRHCCAGSSGSAVVGSPSSR